MLTMFNYSLSREKNYKKIYELCKNIEIKHHDIPPLK